MTLNDLEPLKKRFLVNFSQYLNAAHISILNCDEMAGVRPIQPAYEICSIKRRFQQSRSPRFMEPGAGGRQRRLSLQKEGRHKKSRRRYISPICGEAPRERIFTKFCTLGDMLDVIICANFDVEKLRGLGNTRGQIFEFPIEMAGHPYNSAALPRNLWYIGGSVLPPLWRIQRLDSSPVLVAISRISLPTCNRFYARRDNSGKITSFFMEDPSLTPSFE